MKTHRYERSIFLVLYSNHFFFFFFSKGLTIIFVLLRNDVFGDLSCSWEAQYGLDPRDPMDSTLPGQVLQANVDRCDLWVDNDQICRCELPSKLQNLAYIFDGLQKSYLFFHDSMLLK
jgi:hypothetical protein